MRRYVIIPTRSTEEMQNDLKTTVGKLKNYLLSAGWKVHFIQNAESIFEAYREGVARCRLTPTDFVILCHDDIEILLDSVVFNHLLKYYLSNSNTGFVGVAGSAVITEEANWFACSQRHGAGGGIVFHGHSHINMQPSVYGTSQKAVILDGVFLAATGSVLRNINLNQPKNFTSKWHWYDASFTFQTYRKNLTNVIAPILLRHESGGTYDDSYRKDIPAFVKLYGKYLPAAVN
jgi:hypothetical protein